MTKIATKPKYGKNPINIFFLWNQNAICLGTWYVAYVVMARSKLIPNAFFGENLEMFIIFLQLFKPKSLYMQEMVNLRQWFYISTKCQATHLDCHIPIFGPRSAVGNVSGYRCVSACRFRGREFDPGPVPYFRGD